MKVVEKVWGHELWVVNCPEYCGKLLHVNKGFTCSVHYHPVKQESFYCLEGHVELHVEGHTYQLDATAEPVTIKPSQKHCFTGVDNKSVLLEVSTEHSETDVVRITESRKGK